jgi:hypothetical protein
MQHAEQPPTNKPATFRRAAFSVALLVARPRPREAQMTSVNAELYHREHDRKNEKYEREIEKREAMHPDDYQDRLGRDIAAAIASAEQHKAEGFKPYAYIVGHLMGHCTSEQIDELDEQLARLTSNDTGK